MEAFLIIYACIFVMWSLAYIVAGMSGELFNLFIVFVMIPLIAAFGVVVVVLTLMIAPFLIIFSKRYRNSFVNGYYKAD